MFFDGGREKRGVSLAGKKKARTTPQETAQKSAQAKILREQEMRRFHAAVAVQTAYRRIAVIRRVRTAQRSAFDAAVCLGGGAGGPGVAALAVLTRRLGYFYTPAEDDHRLVELLRHISASIAEAAHRNDWARLWTAHTPLLRGLLTAAFSSLLGALQPGARGEGGAAEAEVVAAAVGGVLSFCAQGGLSGEASAALLGAQLKLVDIAHTDIFEFVRRMVLCEGAAAEGPSTKEARVSCGVAVCSFVSFVKRTLSKSATAARDQSERGRLEEVKRSTWKAMAVSILAAPRASRSDISGPVLDLIASEGYTEWMECAARMHSLLASVLRPEARVDGGPGAKRAATLCVLYTARSKFGQESENFKRLKENYSMTTDKYGRPILLSAEAMVSPEYRSKTVSSIMNFLANVSALPIYSKFSDVASLDATIRSGTDGRTAAQLLYTWLSLANELLMHHSACQIPLHAAMYYLDYLYPPGEDGAEVPPLGVLDEIIDHDGRKFILLAPNSVTESVQGRQRDVMNNDAMDIVDESTDETPESAKQRIQRSSVTGSLGGLYTEGAVKPLFDVCAKDELPSWNNLLDSPGRTALMAILQFCTSDVVASVMQSKELSSFVFSSENENNATSCDFEIETSTRVDGAFGDIQLLAISVFSIVVSSSDNPLPGSETATKSNGHLRSEQVFKDSFLCRNSIRKIISALAFNNSDNPMIKRLWKGFISAIGPKDPLLKQVEKVLIPKLGSMLSPYSSARPHCHAMGYLYLMCITLSHQLMALHDDELYAGKKSIEPAAGHMESFVEILKDVLYHFTWVTPVLLLPFADAVQSPGSTEYSRDSIIANRLCRVAILQAATRLYNHLSIRNERRGHRLDLAGTESVHSAYLPPNRWTWSAAKHAGAVRSELYRPRADDAGLAIGGGGRGVASASAQTEDDASTLWDLGDDSNFKFVDSRMQIILLNSPQVISFEQRAVVLHTLIESDQRDQGVLQDMSVFGRVDTVRIRRNEILQDAFSALGHSGADRMKQRMRVVFISEDGHEEAGIDGGGLFKEFLESFMKAAFDPDNGYFITTESHELVPISMESMQLNTIGGEMEYYKFIGKMLAKAVYSEILLEPQFSPVFLNLLLGRTNSIDDMSYLDTQFYKSLMNIKQMILRGEDVQTLDLHFQTTSGQALIPGGQDILVTNSNALSYIYLLAKHKLNTSISSSKSFLSGFREIIPVSWLRMFNPREMQLVLGGELKPLDLEDLQRNVQYVGGYHPSQPYIQMFWEVVAEFTPQEQGDFLKFITSCSRQPLLGFDKLNPKIGIQEVPARYAEDGPLAAPRLPSAGTCFNLLKLPRYESKDVLREKLKYAIKCNTGFELS